MENLKLTEAAARYGMTAHSFEKLLSKVGWVHEGQVAEIAVRRGFIAKDRKLTILGQGYLFEASRE